MARARIADRARYAARAEQPGSRMLEATCREISRLVAQGATLDEIEAHIDQSTRGLSEEQLSAAWLRDWLFLEHPEPPGDRRPNPLD